MGPCFVRALGDDQRSRFGSLDAKRAPQQAQISLKVHAELLEVLRNPGLTEDVAKYPLESTHYNLLLSALSLTLS